MGRERGRAGSTTLALFDGRPFLWNGRNHEQSNGVALRKLVQELGGGQGEGGERKKMICPMSEVGWHPYQGGNFRATIGSKLWGDKAKDVLPGGPDAGKVGLLCALFSDALCVQAWNECSAVRRSAWRSCSLCQGSTS